MDEAALQSILERARSIAGSDSDTSPGDDVRLIYEAAEVAGIRRDAVDRAIQERLAFREPTQRPGDLLWALAADGDYHLAEFVERVNGQVTVRYQNGATATLPPSATKPFSTVPGNYLDFEDRPGRWTCAEITELKPAERWIFVRLEDDSVRYVAYADARLRTSAKPEGASTPWWTAPLLWAATASAVTLLLTWLVMR